MKRNILLITSLTLLINSIAIAQEQMEVEGAIKIQEAQNADDGTIEYGTAGGTIDFWGRQSGMWKSLTTSGSGGTGLWTESGNVLFPLSNTNTRKIIIGPTSILGNTRMAVGNDASTSYEGVTVSTGSTGKPFYGYSLGGYLGIWTYVDGASTTEDWILYNGGNQLKIGNTGLVTLNSLSGSGNQMVIADNNGVLSSQAIPSWSNFSGIPTRFSDGVDNVNDADASPTNEIENWSTLAGIPSHISDGDDVNDADASPTNEIQTLSITGSDLTISGPGGNTITLPTGGSGGDDDWTLDFAGYFPERLMCKINFDFNNYI